MVVARDCGEGDRKSLREVPFEGSLSWSVGTGAGSGQEFQAKPGSHC